MLDPGRAPHQSIAERFSALVTGGAGYIGSHVVRLLREAVYRVLAYDNLSAGFPWAVLDADLIGGDLAEPERLSALLAEKRFGAVLHFAAHLRVEESVTEPVKYYHNNVVTALGLFEFAVRHGV
jgi:UDP-glucose 4-epimerase